jgi:hypothetical protein
MTAHLSQWELDALALHALAPPAAARAEAHLADCAPCQRAWATLQALHRRFDTDVLPRTLPRLRARAEGAVRRPGWTWTLAPAAALAVALVLGVLWPSSPDPGPEGPEYAIKGGGPRLRVFARRGERVEAVGEGVQLAPGDALRFVVEPEGLPYLLVASLDAAGTVSVYFPYGGQRGERLPEGDGPVELPGSIVLDAAPGPERVWALFSRAPLERAEVEAALRARSLQGLDALRTPRPLAVPADAQDTFLFEKP